MGCKFINSAPAVITNHTFGVLDRLGREIGLRIMATEFDAVPEDRDGFYGYQIEPGHYFTYETQTLRDGKRKRASHGGVRFKTAEERDAAIVKSVNAARKRALAPAARMKA